MKLGPLVEGLTVNTVIKALVVPAPVAEIDEALIDISAAGRYEHSACIFGVVVDVMDHSVDRSCSPKGGARAGDDFDPLDILEHGVLNLPINPSVQWRVNGSAVNKHEYVAGKGTREPAHADRPCIRVDPCDFHTWRQTEGLRDARCPGTSDVFLGDDVNCCRSSASLHGLFRRGCDFDLAELF